jgi:acyl-[acyl-carrier-protein]-phospholipid O-acyltransferase/long-chain-fatty-acid--[acyl-carrier-protein] ligase
MVLASLLLVLFHDRLHASPTTILFVFALMMLAVTAYILTVPECLARFILWTATHTLFRIRALGADNVPLHGPALLVSNHMSHIDGVLINACIDRRVRFMMWKPYFELRAMNWFLRRVDAIPVSDRPREAVESIRATRKVLAEGHVVCIFAEGAVTRTGNLLPFKRGMEKILHGLDVPIVPVHIDRMWGSIFSFEGGRFFWKRPRRIPYPVTVSFGAPLPPTATTHEVRHAIQELAADAIPHRKTAADTLDARFIRNARRHWNRFAMADSTGRELTYGHALVAATMIARQLPADPMIGVLLPASVAGALANLAITLAGRVPVNLNFTSGAEIMTDAVADCGIRAVITSRKFAAHAPTLPDVAILYLEDLIAASGRLARLRAYVSARLAPRRPLAAPDSVATVIFSSGSTGTPKGVALTHYNLLANIEAMAQLFPITPADRIAGVLPFFHSFGFTVTLWFPLVAGCGVVYHPNAADARAVGDLVAKYGATLLLSTPTLCATYTRKVSPEQFATLRYVLVGAEKLRAPIAAGFREKFGLTLLEGYGCTEMGPVIAVNSPGFEWGKYTQVGTKPGTVGHPLPGVAARIVDPATFEPLPSNAEGLLLVKGANCTPTAKVLHGGWYVTGEIALLDDDGFLRISNLGTDGTFPNFAAAEGLKS